MGDIMLKDLLEAGVHFGHQTKRWNPKMKPYIFMEKNSIHIIDLQKTLVSLHTAEEAVRNIAEQGKAVLFLGTKMQAKTAVKEEAERAGMPYVTERWLGGTLTNYETVRRSLVKLEYLEAIEEDGRIEQFSKKEVLKLRKEKDKLLKTLSGVRSMSSLPGLLFIVDTTKEVNAVKEARKLKIPIVGLVDTNADPDEVDYPIPANDDAMRAIRLFCKCVADMVVEGRAKYLEGREAAVLEQAKAMEQAEQGEQQDAGKAREKKKEKPRARERERDGRKAIKKETKKDEPAATGHVTVQPAEREIQKEQNREKKSEKGEAE
ncbi:MAG: 30S ribosomal protein S2 [Chitinivibrionia bacterium]|nr:30S ribosomal protein S2 [Chitinivibrionia bacterium]